MRNIASVAIVVLACAVGCSNVPAYDRAARGIPTRVELLDPSHVSLDGQSMPVEAFVYEIRTRVRAAAGDVDAMPAVTIVAGSVPELAAQRLVQRLVRELGAAGVRSITLGEGGG